MIIEEEKNEEHYLESIMVKESNSTTKIAQNENSDNEED